MTKALLQLADLDPHLVAELGIQVGERLVQQEHFGLDHQRAGERHTLLLAAGELARIALAEMAEAHQFQRPRDPGLGLGLADLPHLETEGDVAGHRHVREESIALEHHAGVATEGWKLGHVLIADEDASRGRLDEARDHAERRRFAAAGGSQQGHQLALLDAQRDVVDHAVGAVDLDQMVECYPGHVRRSSRA